MISFYLPVMHEGAVKTLRVNLAFMWKLRAPMIAKALAKDFAHLTRGRIRTRTGESLLQRQNRANRT